MATTCYITSTANTGTGTLRSFANASTLNSEEKIIQPSPTLFPAGTPCNVQLAAGLTCNQTATIKGAQTRLVLDVSSAATTEVFLLFGTSSVKPVKVDFEDVDFRNFTRGSAGAITTQYCSAHTFTRCTFCGISGYHAPVYIYATTTPTVVFQDCAFYGNRGTYANTATRGAIQPA